MARYVKRFKRFGHALGPSEERGFALWVGYDIEGVDDDLSAEGLEKAEALTEEELAERGVTTFTPVTLEKLGIKR
ncbi:MAG TPA: hypothetical protein VF618_20770 [Thermoanaerobaculia bacterium]